MLSSRLCAAARRLWREAQPTLGPLGPALAEQIGRYIGDEAVLLALACGTLPISDLGSVDADVLAGYGRHALFLRRTSPYCRDVSEQMFLHFVWYPRVNSEDLTDCRAFFYRQLAPRVEGLTDEQAALAVNRWCAEHMTYQATDERTESPMTAFRTGTGRCGEESVFLVTALRSVGLPARQVYVPLWAHCDDNHAWVEVWAGGRWRFLGACEPEPVLDRGWFTAAAARAPLVHYRTFFDCQLGDELTERMGSVRLYGVTERYADTYVLHIQVEDGSGLPAAGAAVELDTANMGALRPLLRARTDGNGRFTVRLGRAGLHVEAAREGLAAEADVCPTADSVELTLRLAPPAACTREIDLAPPPPSGRGRAALSPAQREQNDAVLAACAAARAERAAGWARPEYAAAEEPWPRLFALAAGNAPELWRFYAAHQGRERALAGQMLAAMAEKDCRDVTFDILESHFCAALPYAGTEHFARAVASPRIGLEVLSNWRDAAAAAFTPEQQAAFRARPEALMEHIRAGWPDPEGNWYPTLAMTPLAMLRTGRADETGRRTLFTAVLRSLGVPAVLDPADGSPLYWRDGRWHPAGPERTAPCRLRLEPQAGTRFVYGADWTLSRREGERWRVLDLGRAEDPFQMELAAGFYRLVTALRLPSGGQLCRVTDFAAPPGGSVTLPLILRAALPAQMLSRIPLEPMTLRDIGGRPVSTQALAGGGCLLIWASPGEEPTEHILRELTGAAPALRDRMARGLVLALVLPDRQPAGDGGVWRMLERLPGALLLFDEGGRTGRQLARRLFLEPGPLPLAALLDGEHAGRFGSAGYKTGLAELILKLIDCIGP